VKARASVPQLLQRYTSDDELARDAVAAIDDLMACCSRRSPALATSWLFGVGVRHQYREGSVWSSRLAPWLGVRDMPRHPKLQRRREMRVGLCPASRQPNTEISSDTLRPSALRFVSCIDAMDSSFDSIGIDVPESLPQAPLFLSSQAFGSQSSILFSSGSMIHANFPFSCDSGPWMTSTPAARSCSSSSPRLSTR
jgi:hypothetical protein